MRKITFFPLALVLSLAPATGAQAKPGPGTRAVRKANDTIRELLGKKVPVGSPAEKKLAAQVTTRVRAILDVDELGRRAMVDHWKKLSLAQRKEFSALLRGLVEKNYVKGLRANLDYHVVYTGETTRDSGLFVTTEIKTKRRGRPFTIAIDYNLRRDKKNWRAYDIVTDGVSLIENYRSQFNKLIAKEGFAGLIKRMKRKRDQVDD